jgi:c-di-GMP phosphodiesterase
MVLETAILNQVGFAYSPFVDRNRGIIATRLTVFPVHSDAQLDAGQLLDELCQVWPADGASVSINVASESLLKDLMKAQPTSNIMIEIPAFMAADPSNLHEILTLHSNGNILMIHGQPQTELPREILHCFKYSIVDFSADRRSTDLAPPEGLPRQMPYIQEGVTSLEEMELSFKRGAAAVLGWPIDEVVNTHKEKNNHQDKALSEFHVIVELINLVENQSAIDKIENLLKGEPTLGFKLMRFINSPAFGLRVEISSFRHAVMLLGYVRLKRWLALLLATAGSDQNVKPVKFAAVRRGLLMEELGRSQDNDEMRSEMFICGVFSLLDCMFQQPFSQLMSSIPIPERVHQALVEKTGPYQPYMELLQAIETGSLYDLRMAADGLMMGLGEVNRCTLKALSLATDVE